jgi:hypothetical protein
MEGNGIKKMQDWSATTFGKIGTMLLLLSHMELTPIFLQLLYSISTTTNYLMQFMQPFLL